jgi:hypothetical protein
MLKHIAVLLFAGLSFSAFAQSDAPPKPPAPPAPTEPTAEQARRVVEGTLMKMQRANNDKGKYEWICTYRVEGTNRSVLLDESCPQTLPFELKR